MKAIIQVVKIRYFPIHIRTMTMKLIISWRAQLACLADQHLISRETKKKVKLVQITRKKNLE